MADKKISALTGATTPLAGTEVLPIVQSGATVKVAVSDLTAGRAVTALTYNGNTITTGTGVLTLAAGKTLTASNTLTLAGTDATTQTFPTTSATIARTDAAQTFTGIQTVNGQVKAIQANGTAYSSTSQLRVDSGGVNNNLASITFSDSALSDGKIAYRPSAVASDSWFSISARSSQLDFVLDANGLLRLGAYGAGALTTDAAGTVTAVSDVSDKKNIRPFVRGLSEILAIANDPNGIILYGYSEESGLDQSKNDYPGWSAQVIQKFIPEAVGKMKDDIDSNGVITKKGSLTLNPFGIVAVQTRAIAELNSIIETLIFRIEVLEQK